MLAVNYAMGYRDDRATRFHDILELGKAQVSANAAQLYSASSPDLAEGFMNLIDFQSEVGRKELSYQKALGSSEATIKSVSGKNRIIEHIHANCYEDIVSSWKVPTDERANVELLENFKKHHPSESNKIDLLLSTITGSTASDCEEFLGFHKFVLNL